jgi:imidazolonepropionase-like amidohydrolase
VSKPVGKRADLILLEKNPLRNIKNLKKIRGIMAFGYWYSKEKLQEML